MEPMITDFGFAVTPTNDSKDGTLMGKTCCGSTLYLAPEARMLTNKDYDAKVSCHFLIYNLF